MGSCLKPGVRLSLLIAVARHGTFEIVLLAFSLRIHVMSGSTKIKQAPFWYMTAGCGKTHTYSLDPFLARMAAGPNDCPKK